MMLMVSEESGLRCKVMYRNRFHDKVAMTPVLVLKYTVNNFVYIYRLESHLSRNIFTGCMNVNHSTLSLSVGEDNRDTL